MHGQLLCLFLASGKFRILIISELRKKDLNRNPEMIWPSQDFCLPSLQTGPMGSDPRSVKFILQAGNGGTDSFR